MVNDVDPEVAQTVVDEIVAAGGKATASSHDVGSWSGAEAMVKTAIDTFGRLDTLVCNAGNLRDRMLVNMTEEDWDSVHPRASERALLPAAPCRGLLA